MHFRTLSLAYDGCESTSPKRRCWADTKAYMPTYLSRLACPSPLLLLALLLARSGSLFAQNASLPPLTPQSCSKPEQAAAVNLASIEPQPTITANETTFASGLVLPADPASMAVVAPVPGISRPKEFAPNPYWDRENRFLFVTAGALAAADFCTTRANLASGGKEQNPVTRIFTRQHSGACGKLRARNREHNGYQLYVPQDRSPQAGADYVIGQHWQLCRRRGVWPNPPLIRKLPAGT